MNKLLVILAVILAAALGYVVAGPGGDVAAASAKENAFERVMRTKTLRCGYAAVGLALQKDAHTGQLSGTVYDVMEAIGKALELKIDWAEEVTFGTAIAGLNAGRFDVVCANLYARPNWLPNAELTEPYYYVPVNAYAKAGDTRFTSRGSINTPAIKIAYQDGTVPAFIKKNDFAEAGSMAVVDMDYADILLGVATGKADITFVEPSVAGEFMANNPGRIELVEAVSPLYVFPIVLAVNNDETKLDSMLSETIRFLLNKGEIDRIIQRHEKYPGIFWRATPGYQQPVQP